MILLRLLTITLSSFSEKWVRNKEEDVSFTSLGLFPLNHDGRKGTVNVAVIRTKMHLTESVPNVWGLFAFLNVLLRQTHPNAHPKDHFPNDRTILFLPPIQTCPILSTKTRHLNKKKQTTSASRSVLKKNIPTSTSLHLPLFEPGLATIAKGLNCPCPCPWSLR